MGGVRALKYSKKMYLLTQLKSNFDCAFNDMVNIIASDNLNLTLVENKLRELDMTNNDLATNVKRYFKSLIGVNFLFTSEFNQFSKCVSSCFDEYKNKWQVNETLLKKDLFLYSDYDFLLSNI